MMVVLDTNFITVPAQFKIDIFDEIKKKIPNSEIATTSSVIEELKMLGSEGKIGLAMVDKFGIKVVEREGNVDSALLELAFENKGILCTNDKELKKRARKKNIPVMFIRKKKILELEGGLNV